MIEFCHICKRFGDQVVLDDVSLNVATGEILYIIGMSGAGKSVLVKQLIGLVRPDSGRILLDGEEVTALNERQLYAIRRRCALVFQHSTLFDSMTLAENVALPLRKHRKLSREAALAIAREKLALVRMESMADRYPADIGDGLRKRVAIVRALTMDPRYVIFDEPTTGLDPVAAAQVDRLIRHLSDALNVTSIVVSHDLRSIFTVADRIVMLYQGRLRLDGTPAAFRQSPDPVVHQFIRGLPTGPIRI